MPKKGISLHIGLNRVDPVHYGGWDGSLTACEADAQDMRAIALARGITPQLLLTRQATSAAVLGALGRAAASLRSGDLFFLSYSGHGGQVPDTNHDEADRQDETWVLYDRELVDDELYAAWGKFAAGVRIIALSDSCHSGTVTREMPTFRRANAGAAVSGRNRLMPPDVALRTYRRNKALYDGIQKRNPAGEKARVRATVVLISGCQDNQTSLDGARNGLFTEKLRKVWNRGRFTGGYRLFRDKIAKLMPASQTPNYYVVGAANATFEARTPFKV
jgi:metacaspase-1